MIKTMLRLCLLVAFAITNAPAAHAADMVTKGDPTSWDKKWTIEYGRSKLGFSGMQGENTSFQGAFKSFTVEADFDPARPEKGRIAVTVDIASTSTGDSERDSMLPQKEWFHTERFPQARFVSNDIAEAGIDENGGKIFRANGNLTLKGISQAVSIPFTMVQEGDHWRIQGKTRLLRTDFLVGSGQFADEKTVKFTVNVFFDLIARPSS